MLKPKSGKKSSFLDIRPLPTEDIYMKILTFAKKQFPDINLVDDFSMDPSATVLSASHCVKPMPFVYKAGIRYGSNFDKRTRNDHFACIETSNGSWFPCNILYHFELYVPGQEPTMCSIVQRLDCSDEIPTLPFSL